MPRQRVRAAHAARYVFHSYFAFFPIFYSGKHREKDVYYIFAEFRIF